MGKREIKTDEEIVTHLKTKAYQPYNDPLMPRIAKKYQPKKSTTAVNSTYMKTGEDLAAISNAKSTSQGDGKLSNRDRVFSQGSASMMPSLKKGAGGARNMMTSPE